MLQSANSKFLEVLIRSSTFQTKCAYDLWQADPDAEGMTRETFLGIGICVIDHARAIRFITRVAGSHGKALVNNVNANAMNIAHHNPDFSTVLNDSDIVFCDGFGVKALAGLSGVHLGERMTPREWIDELFDRCAKEGLSLYFLGDTCDVVQRFAKEVLRRHPQIKIAGYRDGYFDMGGRENRDLVEEINRSEASIILVGMGMPRQEIWAYKALPNLNQGVVIAVGALFRVYTGIEKPCPPGLGRYGFEWLWRLIHQPRRLWRRYLVGNAALVLRVCYAAFLKRLLGCSSALLLCILLMPLFALLYAILRIETRGSALFRQERVGKDGKRIRIYKFRTLKSEFPPYVSKRHISPEHINTIGHFLRHSGLDELPQLVNVLRGDMALVGPRPEMPFIADNYQGIEKLRLSVRPGLTGAWQVARLRGETTGREIHEDIDYDINYIRRMGFFLDLRILIQTVFYLAARPLLTLCRWRGKSN